MKSFREAQVWEDGLRTDPNKKSFEWWYFDSSFDSGATLVVTFFTKQVQNSSGPLSPQVSIVYTTPEGEKKSYSKVYAPTDFKASTEKCDVVMGPNTVSGDLKNYKLHLDIDEFKADIEFNRIAPSYSTTENRDSKPVAFGWFPSVPYGAVEGELDIAGVKTKVKGHGYHDHNWGITDMKGFCDYWYWGRGNVEGYYMIFSVMYLRKFFFQKPASILYLATEKGILVGDSEHLRLSKTDITPPQPKVGHLPKQLTFTYQNEGEEVDFTLVNKETIESTDPMGGETGWRKFWTHLFSKPLYVRFNAKLDLNINLPSVKAKKSGSGIYEIMILQ